MLLRVFCSLYRVGPSKFRTVSVMSSQISLLDQIPNVEIDSSGKFKYVLIRVYAQSTSDGNEVSKMIVRGNARGAYHADIYDETLRQLLEMNLDSECVGGGRIEHKAEEKFIKIYGYSQGFGRADHEISTELVKAAYPDYQVTWSNDGY